MKAIKAHFCPDEKTPYPRSYIYSAWKVLRKIVFFFSSLCWLAFRYKPENLFCHLIGILVAVVVKNKTKQKYVSPFLEDSRECQLDPKVWRSIMSDSSFLGIWCMKPQCTQAQFLGLSITRQLFPSIRNRQVIISARLKVDFKVSNLIP